MEELAQAKKTFEKILNQRQTLTAEQKQRLLQLGGSFRFRRTIGMPQLPKKKIIRTVIEMLSFVIHWKGGCHTEFQMEKPCSPVGKATDVEDVELICKMANRYGDGEIARVLNRMNRRTGKGLPWKKRILAANER